MRKIQISKNFFTILIIFILIIVLIFLLNPKKEILKKEACLSLTFDDGLKSHYNIVYPLLIKKDFRATFFIMVNITKDPYKRELMSKNEIKELCESGFEIGSHTLNHPFLTKISEREIENELKNSKEILEEKYNINVSSLAFPYGDYNNKVLNMAKKYYLTARTSSENKRNSEFLIGGYGLTKDSSVENICEYIENLIKKNSWGILVFHDIKQNPSKWDTSLEDFKAILDCADNLNIRVDTINNCKNRLQESLKEKN